MSESVYLIWKLRCERVIQKENTPFSIQEVSSRWITTINARLDLDREMTNEGLGKRRLKTKIVLSTWRGTLNDEDKLPKNWTKLSGVLVGIRLRQHQEGG